MGHPLQETSSENLQGDPFYSHQQTSCGVRYIGDDGNYVNGGSEHIHDVDVNLDEGEDKNVEYAQHGQEGQPALASYLLIVIVIMLMMIVIISMTHTMKMMLMLIY